MNSLETRIRKLEKKHHVDEITVEVKGDKFFLYDKELSKADLTTFSETCERMIFTNYIDDKGVEILKKLDLQCEFELPKWYKGGWSPKQWRH